MLGDAAMRRIFVVVILMLVLAACSSAYGRNDGASDNPSSGGRNDRSTGDAYTTVPRQGYSTLSGQIVDQATGQPYPNAWVRFAWLVDANYEMETHTVANGDGRYEIQLAAGQYQVTAGDDCDLNAGFAIVGRAPDDVMITVPGTSVVDFVEYPITPGADLPGAC
jgi:hypothetical protein